MNLPLLSAMVWVGSNDTALDMRMATPLTLALEGRVKALPRTPTQKEI